MTTVIEVDLAKLLRQDPARRPPGQDRAARPGPAVLHLVKQIMKAGGKIGVPQGGPFSPLAANIYLNEVDWAFDDIRRKTAEGPYEAVNYHRFADDIVITVSGHQTQRGWAERALQRLQEHLDTLRVELNREKTKMVDTLKGEAFGFLGFDLRRVHKRKKDGYFNPDDPKKKARQGRESTRCGTSSGSGGATPVTVTVRPRQRSRWPAGSTTSGWATPVVPLARCAIIVEMKIRTLLTRRKRRRKPSMGWRTVE